MTRTAVHRSGFTLLELLVSLAISVVIAMILLTVIRGAVDLWSRSTGELRAAAQANAILDRVQSDLEAAVFCNDGGVWLAATVLSDSSLSGWWQDGVHTKPGTAESTRLEAAAIDDCRFGLGVWLRLFVSGSEDGAAAVRAVGYQLIRRELAPDFGEYGYLLHRAEVSAANTFEAGYDLDPANGGYRARSGTPGDAGNLIRPPLSSVIGDHVVDFGLRLYRIDGDSLVLLFPRTGEAEYLAGSESHIPAVAEVMVRVLDDTGVRRLIAMEEGWSPDVSDDAWWRIVEQHSRVVVRRVVLPVGQR